MGSPVANPAAGGGVMKFPLRIQLRLQPRERLLGVGSGLVLLAVVLDRLVLNPWLHHAQTVRQEIQRMEQGLQTRTRLLERKDSILAAHERYRRYLRPAIADDLQMAALLKEIEDLAWQSDVRLGEIKPSAVETTALLKRYSLDVQFECSMDEWVEFIYRIETSPSLYGIIRAGLSRHEEEPDQLEGYVRLVSTAPQTKDPGSPTDTEESYVAATR